jgi:predicted RNA-binding Zn-ribbon protein involved in translation (DUF1610 family)
MPVKRFIAIILITLSLLITHPVNAQNTLGFSKMMINIWPEYDRPGVLVFYQMTLSAQTSLPATLSIRIPKAAVEPFNVAMKDVDGRLDSLRSTSVNEGDWIKVTFTTPVPEVQFEYYDPSILKGDALRQYEYSWPGDYSIESLVLNIQQPLNVSDFLLKPAMGTGQLNPDGFTYYESFVGQVNAGVTFNIHLEYQKKDTSLSAPSQSVVPVEPINTNTAGWQTLNEVLPYILSGLGLLLILAGIYWYWRSGKTITTAFRKRYSETRTKNQDTETSEFFCPRCGRKALHEDIFCRSCGSKLHGE